jgi:hypothetical protein
MAFITTNPNPHILNLPTLQNVITSATGTSSGIYVTNLQNYINTSNSSLKINTVGLYTTTLSYITFTSGINLSNASLFINGSSYLSPNTVSGSNYLAFQIAKTEQARFTGGYFGIGTKTPLAPIDINGNCIVRGNLFISSLGAVSQGNLFADGDLFANGIHYPSDPVLKTDVSPYIAHELPEAVRFRWKASGKEDIGVLADDILRIEPVCVQTTRNGTLAVDYPKLVVLCLAEIKALKQRVAILESAESPR